MPLLTTPEEFKKVLAPASIFAASTTASKNDNNNNSNNNQSSEDDLDTAVQMMRAKAIPIKKLLMVAEAIKLMPDRDSKFRRLNHLLTQFH